MARPPRCSANLCSTRNVARAWTAPRLSGKAMLRPPSIGVLEKLAIQQGSPDGAHLLVHRPVRKRDRVASSSSSAAARHYPWQSRSARMTFLRNSRSAMEKITCLRSRSCCSAVAISEFRSFSCSSARCTPAASIAAFRRDCACHHSSRAVGFAMAVGMLAWNELGSQIRSSECRQLSCGSA